VTKNEKLDELVGSVEELLSRLPEGLNPQISALRDKVDDGIFDAWTAISAERLRASRAWKRAAPLTMGAAVGLAVLLAFSARLLLERSRQLAAGNRANDA
jgi:type VI protein secretion system component VasF